MANESDVSLLFKLRMDAQQTKTASAEARVAVQQLRSAFGTELSQMGAISQSAFQAISNHVSDFARQRVPIAGNAVANLGDKLQNLGRGSASKELDRVGKSIGEIARQSGRSSSEIAGFLTRFVQIEGQAKRDKAAVDFFGATLSQKLIPQLESTGEALVQAGAAAGGMGGSFAAAAGPIGIAIVALVALAGATVIVAKEIFDLTKRAAEFQGAMFDLSQQTGISVETLSALEVVATTTGGSLGSMTASLGIFQRKLEEAENPLSKAALKFRELGVETEDTEKALRQTLKAVSDMRPGFQQTALALELFGRGGKQLLAVLKETGGDLDGTIAKLRELGILITTEEAKAADEFNDQLALIGFQLRDITAELARVAMPIILAALQDFSNTLRENRDVIRGVAAVIGVFTQFLTSKFREAMLGARIFIEGHRAAWRGLVATLNIIIEAYEKIRQKISAIISLPPIPRIEPPPPAGEVPEQVEPENAVAKELKETIAAQDNITAAHRAGAEERKRIAASELAQAEANFARGQSTRRQEVEAQIKANQEKIQADINLLEFERSKAQKQAALAAVQGDLQQQKELRAKITELDSDIANRRSEIQNFEVKARAQLQAEERKNEIAHFQRRAEIASSADRAEIEFIKARVQTGVLLAADGQRQIEEIVRRGFDRQRSTLAIEIGLLTGKVKEARAIAASLSEGVPPVSPQIISEINKQVAALEDAFAREKAVRDNAVTEANAADKRRLDSLTETLRAERQRLSEQLDVTRDAAKRAQILDALAPIEQTLKAAGEKFDQAVRDRTTAAQQAEIDQLNRHEQAKFDLLQSSQRRLNALVQAGRISQPQADQQQVALEERLREAEEQRLRQSLTNRNLDVTSRAAINARLQRLDEQRTASENAEHDRREAALTEARNRLQSLLQNVREPADRQRFADQLAALDQQQTANEQQQALARNEITRTEFNTQRDILLAAGETALRINEINNARRLASIQALADAEVISQEAAARRVLKVQEDSIRAQEDLLRARLIAAKAIQDPNERAKVEADLNNQLRVLQAERRQIQEEGNRQIDEGRKNDVQNARAYAEELRSVDQAIVDIQLEAAREEIELMKAHHARRRDIIRAQRDLEIAEENERHRRVTEEITRERRQVEERIKVFESHLKNLRENTTDEIEERDRLIKKLEELRQKLIQLQRQQAAEDRSTETRKRRVTKESEDEEKELDPFEDLKVGMEEIKEFAAELQRSVVPLGQILSGTFNQISQAIGQTVANWVLLGETGPAVMRKILAQALASIAAEASVNAIKELALGFAMLFINPAESAAHFASAGLWASIAGVSAIAGRSAAGNLFKPAQKTDRSGVGNQGSTGDGKRDPIDLIRNQLRQEIHLYLHNEPGPGFGPAVVNSWIDNVRSNGPARVTVKEVAES